MIARSNARGLVLSWVLLMTSVASAFENDRVTCISIGPHDTTVPLDEAHITSPVPGADIAKMQQFEPYAGLTASEIQARIEATRRCLILAIGLISGEDMEAGDWLDFLYRSDGICVGLGGEYCVVDFEVIPDGEEGLSNAERINIYQTPDTCTGPTDFNVFRAYSGLCRMAGIARQQCFVGTTPTPQEEGAYLQCQKSAGEFCLIRLYDCLEMTNELSATGELPPGVTGAVRECGKALKQENNPVRIQSWQLGCQREIIVRQNRDQVFTTYVRTTGMAQEGQPYLSTVLRDIRFQTGAYTYSSFTDNYNAVYYTVPPILIENPGVFGLVVTSPEVHAFSSTMNASQSMSLTQVQAVSDLLKTPTHLFVSGVDYINGLGVVQAFEVNPGTGLFNTTAAATLSTPLLNGSACLMSDFNTGVIGAVNCGTGQVYECDVFASTLNEVGFTVPRPSIFSTVDCSYSSREAVTCSTYPFGGAVPLIQPTSVAANQSTPYSLQPTVANNCAYVPSFMYAPDRLSGCVELCGTPGRTFQVTGQSGGGPANVLASGRFAFRTGRCTVDLGAAANTTDIFHCIDSAGAVSAGSPGGAFPASPTLSFVTGSTGDLFLRNNGQPGQLCTWSQSSTLQAGSFAAFSSNQCGRAGYSYEAVPSANITIQPSGFYQCSVPAVSPTPVATADSFECTAGLTEIFNCAANDEGCPLGTTYELVSGPALPPEAFEFSSDGSIKVTMLTFLGGTSFTYRPVYLKKHGEPVSVVLTESTGKLTNPRTYIGEDNVEMVELPCLVYLGENFPLYQFWLRPPDNCFFIHWHWRGGTNCFSLEQPLLETPDPAPFVCGFGVLGELQVRNAYLKKSDWENFYESHP